MIIIYKGISGNYYKLHKFEWGYGFLALEGICKIATGYHNSIKEAIATLPGDDIYCFDTFEEFIKFMYKEHC